MKISLKCYATLRQYQPDSAGQLEVPPTASVRDLLEQLGIDSREVKLIFVNNKSAGLDARLQDGDSVGLFPAVGGG